MILEFSLKNYLSFAQKQTLSFDATAEKNFRDVFTVKKRNFDILKLAVIYGPNASGKTNLLYALRFLREKIVYQPQNKLTETKFVPFRFNKDTISSPGEFELKFFIDDEFYIYNLQLTEKKIVREELKFYPSSRAATLFRRITDKDGKVKIEFSKKYCRLIAAEKKVLEGNTLPNGTVLAATTVTNLSQTRLERVVSYAKKMVTIVEPEALFYMTVDRLNKDKALKRFILDNLPLADFNITDIKVQRKKIDKKISKSLQELLNSLEAEKEVVLFERKIEFFHKIEDKIFSLPENLESDGTLKFIGILGLVYDLINNKTLALMDELEHSLHYELQKYFLKMFVNTARDSQLIITTHNPLLIDQNLLRRDVIWFVDKNKQGSSELYSLADFKLHKNVSAMKYYLSGKLGAYPTVID